MAPPRTDDTCTLTVCRDCRATAAAVPGARLVVYPGMGHDLPRPLWPEMVGELCALTGRPA